MKPALLSVSGVGKCYATYSSNLARFATWFGASARPVSEYWAVKDVSFDLRPGEALALIGQNGAGKSTLLKMITGTVRPTKGQIAVNGTISAILELGLGFNPEFTGRQNIYQAGGLMGFSHEKLATLMPDIEAFAEIGEFFDQPLRMYSSGMQARLAFALVTAVRPDVLIVDEVLSVGDSYFQHKSFDRIRQFKDEGAAILFVSHALSDVRSLCDRVLLLDKGTVLKDGQPDEVVDYYNAMIAEKENGKLTIEQKRNLNGWLHTRSGTGEVVIERLSLVDAVTQEPVDVATVGQELEVVTVTRVKKDVPRLVLGQGFSDRTGRMVWGTNTWHTKQVVFDVKAGCQVEYRLRFPCNFGPGSYSISSSLVSSDTHLENNYEWQDNIFVFEVINADKDYFVGSTYLPSRFEVQVIE